MSFTPLEAQKQHPSRRSVLKVGAHAAWAVPAIQIATAAPSFATGSGIVAPSAILSVTAASGFNKSGQTVKASFLISNAAERANASDVVVTFTGDGVDFGSVRNIGADWTAAGPGKFKYAGTLTSGTGVTLTFDANVGTVTKPKGAKNYYAVSVGVTGANVGPTTGAATPSGPITANFS